MYSEASNLYMRLHEQRAEARMMQSTNSGSQERSTSVCRDHGEWTQEHIVCGPVSLALDSTVTPDIS